MTQDQLNISQSLSSEMGKKGEAFALAYERKRLPSFLHDRIVYFGEHEVAMGYDILSFDTKDDLVPERYIEVKTFRGHPHFYWTDNEIVTARHNADSFYLYLVNYDHIKDPDYEPMIIPNPFLAFKDYLPAYFSDEKNGIPHTPQWAIQVPHYLITLLNNDNIPEDWDDSIVILGCFKGERHLNWIRSHMLYNVRTQKNVPGSVATNSPLVQKAKYLLLYSVANPQVYYLYSLKLSPYLCYKQDLIALNYPDPRCYSYNIHPMDRQLGTFFINLAPLLRKINHRDGNTYGTPQYFPGIQLRQLMASDEPVKMVSDYRPPYKVYHSQSSVAEQDKQGSLWTQEEDTTLLDSLQAHTPISEISAKLSRSEKAVTRRMDRLRSQRILSFELYIHYYDNDPAFASKKKFNESTRKK